MEFLYRAMVEAGDTPKLGASATTLGVRRQIDIDADDFGNVHRPDFRHGEKNGMSCSPSIADLPDFAIPVEWGGGNKRVRVWRIRVADLGPDLTAEQDGSTHISIGPSRTMPIEEYVQAIQATASKWELLSAHGKYRYDISE